LNLSAFGGEVAIEFDCGVNQIILQNFKIDDEMSEIAVEDIPQDPFRDRMKALLRRYKKAQVLLKKEEEQDYMETRSVCLSEST